MEKGEGLRETHVVLAGAGSAEEGRGVTTVGWGWMCVALGVVGPVSGLLGASEVDHGDGLVYGGEIVGCEVRR